MMYNVKLFYDTGFNTLNIPDSPAILDRATYRVFDGVYKRQNRVLSSVRLSGTFEDFDTADYCKIGDAYYFINSATMISDNTCQLQLQFDALTSCGGAKALAPSIINGWVSRCHTAKDELFENCMDEPFMPSDDLDMSEPVTVGFTSDTNGATDFVQILGTTVDISSINKTASAYKCDELGTSVVVPDLKGITGETQIVFDADTNVYDLPNTRLYLYDSSTKANINKAVADIRALGVESAITCSYLVPLNAIQIGYDAKLEFGELKKLKGKWEKGKVIKELPFLYKDNVKNKKTLTLYQKYKIIAVSSGDTLEFDADDIYTDGILAPAFDVLCDASPNGTNYCKPTKYKGFYTKNLAMSITGAPWLNQPLALSGASGSAISNSAYYRNSMTDKRINEIYNKSLTKEKERADTNLIAGAVGNALNPISSIMNLPGIFQSGVNYWYDNEQRILDRTSTNTQYRAGLRENTIGIMTQNSVSGKVPAILFPQSTTMQCFYGNEFLLYQYRMNDKDIRNLDKMFNMFGYTQDREFELEDMTSRVHFNYLQFSDVHIKNPHYPQSTLNIASNQLIDGVRVWHELPNAEAYDDNPIKEVKKNV